jgi:hypothetical protein
MGAVKLWMATALIVALAAPAGSDHPWAQMSGTFLAELDFTVKPDELFAMGQQRASAEGTNAAHSASHQYRRRRQRSIRDSRLKTPRPD